MSLFILERILPLYKTLHICIQIQCQIRRTLCYQRRRYRQEVYFKKVEEEVGLLVQFKTESQHSFQDEDNHYICNVMHCNESRSIVP